MDNKQFQSNNIKILKQICKKSVVLQSNNEANTYILYKTRRQGSTRSCYVF